MNYFTIPINSKSDCQAEIAFGVSTSAFVVLLFSQNQRDVTLKITPPQASPRPDIPAAFKKKKTRVGLQVRALQRVLKHSTTVSFSVDFLQSLVLFPFASLFSTLIIVPPTDVTVLSCCVSAESLFVFCHDGTFDICGSGGGVWSTTQKFQEDVFSFVLVMKNNVIKMHAEIITKQTDVTYAWFWTVCYITYRI